MNKLEKLTAEYTDLIKARRELNSKIKKIRDQIRGLYAKEKFKAMLELLDIDPKSFLEEIEEDDYEE